jgi:hypothetical protein
MMIDSQLAKAGWLVQSREEMNRSAGLGVAVREFPTASGPVDYALFVGGTLCGVIEAKPEGTTLSGFSDQAARYWAACPSISSDARASSALNTSPRAPRSFSAIMPIRRHARAASSFFTDPRRCADGSTSR